MRKHCTAKGGFFRTSAPTVKPTFVSPATKASLSAYGNRWVGTRAETICPGAYKLAQNRFADQKQLKKWRATVAKSRLWPPQALEDVEAAILQSDLERVLGNYHESLDLLKKLGELAKDRYLGAAISRSIEARIAIENQLPLERAVTLPAGVRPSRWYIAPTNRGLSPIFACAT